MCLFNEINQFLSTSLSLNMLTLSLRIPGSTGYSENPFYNLWLDWYRHLLFFPWTRGNFRVFPSGYECNDGSKAACGRRYTAEEVFFFRDLMKKWNPKWPPWGHNYAKCKKTLLFSSIFLAFISKSSFSQKNGAAVKGLKLKWLYLHPNLRRYFRTQNLSPKFVISVQFDLCDQDTTQGLYMLVWHEGCAFQ
jgi:hypothetical protein